MAATNSAQSTSMLAIETAFRLQDLPGEQRNSVYRHLFDNILKLSHDFHVWKEEDGLPQHPHLLAYCHLIRTCKQVKHEASTIFEAEYLPNMTFYFDDEKKLRKASHPDADSVLASSTAKMVLRAQEWDRVSLAVSAIPLVFRRSDADNLITEFHMLHKRREGTELHVTEKGYAIISPEGVMLRRMLRQQGGAGMVVDSASKLRLYSVCDATMFARTAMQPSVPGPNVERWAAVIRCRFSDIDWAYADDVKESRGEEVAEEHDANGRSTESSWPENLPAPPSMELLWL